MFTFVGTGYTGRSLIESTTTQTSREEPALRITGCTSMLSLAAPESEPLQTFVAGAHGPVKLRARDSWSGQEHVCRMPSAHSWARRRTPCAEEARLDPHAAPAHERPAPPADLRSLSRLPGCARRQNHIVSQGEGPQPVSDPPNSL